MSQRILNVHDFPRPPAIEKVERRVHIILAGEIVADTSMSWRILETTHPPTYYLPLGAFRTGMLVAESRRSFCEWKGSAIYYGMRAGGRMVPSVAWGYSDPSPAYAALRDHVAVYAGPMDGCFVDGEKVRPQPGGFYGGWITDEVSGPFKGSPGTELW